MATRNPPVIPTDTPPSVWRRQMAAIASRSVEERLEEWASFNRALRVIEADGVRRRHPDYDDRQVLLAVVRRRFGDEPFRHAWPHDDLVDP